MVVEDDAFTRSMIVSALQIQGIDVVSESSSVGFAIKTARLIRPDVAILDLDLGTGPTGIDLAIGLRMSLPKIGIVLLTTFEDPRLLRPSLPEMPIGSIYLTKSKVGEIEVLQKAVTKSITNMNSKDKQNVSSRNKSTEMPELTDVQIETMRLIAQGLSNASIAKHRKISEKSVEQAISRLAAILNFTNSKETNQRVLITNYFHKMTGTNTSSNA
jgi:DNA-binding NarL/FixJ family response regulator